METNLLVGDRLFVTKFSYGYSKHSFPFSPPIFKGRILNKNPKRGDVIVFKTPADNRTDYIKRLIGLPGDTIQFINGDLYLNGNQILKTIKSKIRKNCSPKHVPSLVIKVPEIPRTKSGKIVELAVRKVIHGETINNKEAIANPESLKFFENLSQLKS